MNFLGPGVLMTFLACAMFTDVRHRKIPNVLVAGGTVLALTIAGLQGWQVLMNAAGGWAVGIVLLMPFYALRGMSAGDVKLMGMAGAFLGMPGAMLAVLYAFAAGGVLALGWRVASHGTRRQAWQESLPYAVAIAVGAGICLFTQHVPSVTAL